MCVSAIDGAQLLEHQHANQEVVGFDFCQDGGFFSFSSLLTSKTFLLSYVESWIRSLKEVHLYQPSLSKLALGATKVLKSHIKIVISFNLMWKEFVRLPREAKMEICVLKKKPELLKIFLWPSSLQCCGKYRLPLASQSTKSKFGQSTSDPVWLEIGEEETHN